MTVLIEIAHSGPHGTIKQITLDESGIAHLVTTQDGARHSTPAGGFTATQAAELARGVLDGSDTTVAHCSQLTVLATAVLLLDRQLGLCEAALDKARAQARPVEAL